MITAFFWRNDMKTDTDVTFDQAVELETLRERVMSSSLGRAIGADAATRLLVKYRLHLEDCIGSLLGHINKEDMESIRNVAHSLKGSGKSYGMDFVSEVGESLSVCAKKKDMEGLRGLINELNKWVLNCFPGDLI